MEKPKFQLEKLRDLLEYSNVKRVAEAAGVPRRTLYGCLRGEHEPRRQTLEKIAGFFEIPVEWFYEPYEEGVTKGGER